MSTTAIRTLAVAELTQAYLGEAMNMPELFDRLARLEVELESPSAGRETLWVGSVGYERYLWNCWASLRARNGTGYRRIHSGEDGPSVRTPATHDTSP